MAKKEGERELAIESKSICICVYTFIALPPQHTDTRSHTNTKATTNNRNLTDNKNGVHIQKYGNQNQSHHVSFFSRVESIR